MANEYKKRRVVVTGLGPISPLGFDTESLWKSLATKKLSLRQDEFFTENGEHLGTFWIHKINNFNINAFGIAKQELEYIDNWKKGYESRILQYLLAAVKTALYDSGINYNRDKNAIGSFITVEHPDFEAFCDKLVSDTIAQCSEKEKITSKAKILEYIYSENSDKGYDLHTFMYLYFINKVFGFHGYSLFINNACASGLYALEAAARQIKEGYCDIAIVAAGDGGGNFYKHRWFNDRQLYARDGKIKPFSQDADGFVLGEGASAFVLESFEHAKKRGAAIYAEYLGGGFTIEGWKVIYPDVTQKYYQNCIEQALTRAQLEPESIDVINPHGVGMKITDTYEAGAINSVFSKSSDYTVTAFKPYIGHNLGGSGLLESMILLLMMQKNTILPVLNCAKPIKQVKNEIATTKKSAQITTAIKTSCGFAGYNGAVVFKKV